jgi:capsule polysaccharide export protein KpsE/RkpR
MHTASTDTSEVSILNRILRPKVPTFSPEGAEDILSLDFDQADKDRMRELSAKARAGTLTAAEDAVAGKYELVGHLLNIMQSKARRSLKSRSGRDGKKPRIH